MKVFNHIIIEITTNIIDFHFSYESNNIKYFFNLFQNRNQTKTQAKRAKSLTQKKRKLLFWENVFCQQTRRQYDHNQRNGLKISLMHMSC